MSLILASTSIYRSNLLLKTGLQFKCVKPLCDEESLKQDLVRLNKSPLEIAEFLSMAKGKSLIKKFPEATIISGDQLVSVGHHIFGKPKNFENAFTQLNQMNGSEHQLITATSIFSNGQLFHNNNTTKFKMKKLKDSEIKNYLELDEPYDCAGSCKIEAHGLALFESIDCSDFSAIEGLPLIWVTNTLKGLGYELFKK